MLELIRRLFELLFPARGKRREETPAPVPILRRPAPHPWTVPAETVLLDSEASPMVRPYVIAWERERERERQRQRERRTAATLATLGIDYEGLSA